MHRICARAVTQSRLRLGVAVSIYVAGWIGSIVFFVLSGPLRVLAWQQPHGIGHAFATQFVGLSAMCEGPPSRRGRRR